VSGLTIRGLVKSFGDVDVLRGLDLDVRPGALAAVLGPSGCGKTTLLRIVAGFERPDAGEVALDGRVVAGPSVSVAPERRRVGVVPQEGALFPHLSVAGNVAFGLARDVRRASRVDEVLDLVGLGGFGRRMPAELSGGQQQRVALARALAPKPALVLLDEPFSALDTGLRAAVREDVRIALRRAGATAVLVTHDQQEALSMADVVAVVRDGRVVQAAPPAVLYREPHDICVATFIGEAIVLDAVVNGGMADSALGRVAIRSAAGAIEGAGTLVIRPEQVVITEDGAAVPAEVLGTVFYGHDALVQLRLAGTASPIQVAARTQGPVAVGAADTVRLQVVGEASFFPTAKSRPAVSSEATGVPSR
jgi:iron(III) transport system ATP-binding protein